MVNAELKFCVLIITVSILVGIVWIRAHLARQFKSPDKKIYFWSGIFLISICISTLLVHNLERICIQLYLASITHDVRVRLISSRLDIE